MKRSLIRSITAGISILMLTWTFSAATVTAAGTTAIKKKLVKLIDSNAKASGKVKQFAKDVLLKQIDNQVFITAVKAQNAKGVALSKIKQIDNQWKDAEDELPIHGQMLNNPCADEIGKLTKKFSAIGETFVMDNQGANVCQNELTSDYWQGDEAKWKNSFNNRSGGIDVGTEKLDKSTNMVLQQFSLPIVDNSGQVIGAVTFGVKTGNL